MATRSPCPSEVLSCDSLPPTSSDYFRASRPQSAALANVWCRGSAHGLFVIRPGRSATGHLAAHCPLRWRRTSKRTHPFAGGRCPAARAARHGASGPAASTVARTIVDVTHTRDLEPADARQRSRGSLHFAHRHRRAGILAHDPARTRSSADLGHAHRALASESPDSEIAGQVLVAIWNESTAEHTCPECQMQVPTQTTCHACGTDIELHPHLLGCMALECQQRLWRRIFCPRCDALHTTLQGIANDENKRTLEPTGALS